MNQSTSLLLIFGLITAFIGLAVFVRLKKYSSSLSRKFFALVLTAAAFVRYMYETEANRGTIASDGKYHFLQGINMFSPFGADIVSTIISLFLTWFTFTALLTIVLDQFFEYKTLRHLTNFFALPVLILDIVFFDTYAAGIIGTDVFTSFDLRLPLLCVEIGLGLGLVMARFIEEGKFPVPTWKETGSLLLALPFALLTIIPTYIPYAIFGEIPGVTTIDDFNYLHRIVLYFAIIVPFLIFQAIKDKPQDVKRFVMIFMSLGLMWTYMRNYTLADATTPWSWPLHLCNTAQFIIPICLIFGMKKLFNFTLFINVLGAFLAMIMPNFSNSPLSNESVHFWINHYPAFFMPLLLVALKIFERPKFKQWVYSQIAFCGYFFAMIFANGYFTGIGHETDFFFLNSDFIVDKLGKWAEKTRDFILPVTIGEVTMEFYPIYQSLFFLVYVVASVGMWFLYAILFKSWDSAEDRRLKERDYKRMKKELTEFLGGRNINEPITGDNSPSLVLKHFRKKYGRNQHYSVNDVSFEVKGGEVFGFLGPNGAGKSTIIKSVVGIQTITEGNIEVCGYDVDRQSIQAKHNLGFVPDHYALYENLTGREYINYIADLYSVSQKDRDERIEGYVESFQLTGSFDNQMKTYSHGMKQKIAIMAALVHNPKVWILDEPLTGLDPNSIHEVKECMKAHAAKGNIVFFSSHIIDVVEKICDKIAIIKKGKLRACITLKELEERGIDLEHFYLSIIENEDPDYVDISLRREEESKTPVSAAETTV